MNTGSTSARTGSGRVLIVGGGPAGMMAALQAARLGARVTLLEKNEKLGKKLYITGKGRCNATNTAELDEFFRQVPHNPRFLQAAIRTYTAEDLRNTLLELGVPTVEERGGRVFPESQKASDVTRGLARGLERTGVRVRLNSRVRDLIIENGAFVGLTLWDGEALRADACILAAGGASYPSTGSDGDGYRLAREAGHSVYPPLPALVPLMTEEDWPRSLQGLSLKNVSLHGRLGKKKLYDGQGELLFTHFGLSGPLVLEMSSAIQGLPFGQMEIWLDMKPALTEEQLDARLTRDFAQEPRKQLVTLMAGLLPARMAQLAPGLLGLDPLLPAHQVRREQRWQIARWLKRIPLHVTGTRGLEEAIITRGGVEVKEINPSTMESKKVPGLYFAGELIDVDANTGGFNLQIAFSTGVLAGRHAAAINERNGSIEGE